MRRRELLAIGTLIAAALALPPVLRHRAQDFDFLPLEGFDGFRRLAGGSVSAGPDFLVGIDTAAGAQTAPDPQLDLCTDIFGPDGWSTELLPVAVFSDYYCPICAVFEQRLVALHDAGSPIRLIWHELPLLGPRSVWAAQVALAADRQGAYAAVHRDLMQRALRPGAAGVRDLALRHNLDAEQMLRDAQGPDVADKLQRSLARGRILGLPGTPGSFIGRTLVVGGLERRRIEQLMALERSEPFFGCA